PSSVPEPVTPAQTPVAEPVPATTPQPPGPVAPSPTPTVPAAPETPNSAPPAPASSTGAVPSASGVDIPVANAVTIQAADTLEAIEDTPEVTARATGTTTATNQGSGAHGLSQDPTLSYIAHIRNWLGQHKYYPVAARRNGAQGTV